MFWTIDLYPDPVKAYPSVGYGEGMAVETVAIVMRDESVKEALVTFYYPHAITATEVLCKLNVRAYRGQWEATPYIVEVFDSLNKNLNNREPNPANCRMLNEGKMLYEVTEQVKRIYGVYGPRFTDWMYEELRILLRPFGKSVVMIDKTFE